MAAEQFDIYKCGMDCPGLVEVIIACGDEKCRLSCCDEPMKKQDERTSAIEGKEKHVPVIERIDGGYKVKIGSVPHPMEQEHYIQFVEVRAGKDAYYHFFSPGDAPEAVFRIDAEEITAREFCNKHGLWTS